VGTELARFRMAAAVNYLLSMMGARIDPDHLRAHDEPPFRSENQA
jgi:hypothetical protein